MNDNTVLVLLDTIVARFFCFLLAASRVQSPDLRAATRRRITTCHWVLHTLLVLPWT